MGQFSMEILGCAGSVLSGNQQSEIARLIEAMPTVMAIKDKWPGAKVMPTRTITADSYWWENGDELPF